MSIKGNRPTIHKTHGQQGRFYFNGNSFVDRLATKQTENGLIQSNQKNLLCHVCNEPHNKLRFFKIGQEFMWICPTCVGTILEVLKG